MVESGTIDEIVPRSNARDAVLLRRKSIYEVNGLDEWVEYMRRGYIGMQPGNFDLLYTIIDKSFYDNELPIDNLNEESVIARFDMTDLNNSQEYQISSTNSVRFLLEEKIIGDRCLYVLEASALKDLNIINYLQVYNPNIKEFILECYHNLIPEISDLEELDI